MSTTENKVPIHETLLVGALLAVSAGGLDAYSYLIHGKVFAGLQTGNLILLGIHSFSADGPSISRYIISISAFMLGTILVRLFQQHHPNQHTPRQQLFILGWELFFIFLVSIFSSRLADHWSSAVLSMVAAAQLQEFRKLKGDPFTSLMMTGNFRTLAANVADGLFLKDRQAWGKAVDIGVILVSFFVGAALTGILTPHLQDLTILVSGGWLVLAMLVLVFYSKRTSN